MQRHCGYLYKEAYMATAWAFCGFCDARTDHIDGVCAKHTPADAETRRAEIAEWQAIQDKEDEAKFIADHPILMAILAKYAHHN
jgi:hypothetical protein